ncbi:unnamed protein product [Bodo saltans]|uniref:Uncharacterized protein n=1 Tax=Bodo saltans TaxID=75058 RepID=A0A0S4J3M8_BODSA|nr:unnamed protein product [Bodo saltans]|eukprot:CUG69498.1 unnamed protein product [Bodo saltans]
MPSYVFQPGDANQEWVLRQKQSATPSKVIYAPSEEQLITAASAVADTEVIGTRPSVKRPRPEETAAPRRTLGTRLAKAAPAVPQRPASKLDQLLAMRRTERVANDVVLLSNEQIRTALKEFNVDETTPQQQRSLPPEVKSKRKSPERKAERNYIDVETERILFPDGDLVAFVPKNEPLWDYPANAMITTRTITALLDVIRHCFPDHLIIDSFGFEVLRKHSRPYPPQLIKMRMACVVFHHSHFVAFGYDPFVKKAYTWDSCKDHYESYRREVFYEFVAWLSAGSNRVVGTETCFKLQAPGSNDCGLFALNAVIRIISNQHGILSRKQLAQKHEDPTFQFALLREDPLRPLPKVSLRQCPDCGKYLRQMTSKERGHDFWRCPDMYCREGRGPWRAAWDAE